MNMKEKLELLGKNSIVLKIAKKEKYKLGASASAKVRKKTKFCSRGRTLCLFLMR